jgi:hypothetical protein
VDEFEDKVQQPATTDSGGGGPGDPSHPAEPIPSEWASDHVADDAAIISNPLDMNADQSLLGVVSGHDYMPMIDHALDQLTVSVDLFDVPAGFGADLGNSGDG